MRRSVQRQAAEDGPAAGAIASWSLSGRPEAQPDRAVAAPRYPSAASAAKSGRWLSAYRRSAIQARQRMSRRGRRRVSRGSRALAADNAHRGGRHCRLIRRTGRASRGDIRFAEARAAADRSAGESIVDGICCGENQRADLPRRRAKWKTTGDFGNRWAKRARRLRSAAIRPAAGAPRAHHIGSARAAGAERARSANNMAMAGRRKWWPQQASETCDGRRCSDGRMQDHRLPGHRRQPLKYLLRNLLPADMAKRFVIPVAAHGAEAADFAEKKIVDIDGMAPAGDANVELPARIFAR